MKTKEAKEIVTHEIAPYLSPTVSGMFQVRLNGIDNAGRYAEIELRLVDDDGNALHSFGGKVVPAGGTITLHGLKSTITF